MAQSTRATHHASSEKADVKAAKDRIAWILQHRDSRDRAISSQGLAAAVGLKPTTVRDCIKEIRRDRDLPIVSYNQGYYLIGSVDELERFVEKKRSTINTHKETLQEQVQAFNRERYGKGDS